MLPIADDIDLLASRYSDLNKEIVSATDEFAKYMGLAINEIKTNYMAVASHGQFCSSLYLTLRWKSKDALLQLAKHFMKCLICCVQEVV